MVIINVPIESLEERYSRQWLDWIPKEIDRLKVKQGSIYPEPLCKNIRNGSFLDVVGTNYFKAMQLAEIMQCIDEGTIEDGDTLFFWDLWFPGLEMLAYVRDALGLDLKITGILHAGTYDSQDFLSKKGMGAWGIHLEKCWLEFVDIVFVATQFHKDLIVKERGSKYADKIKVTGLPYYDTDIIKSQKENMIVFPHRLDDEKQPELFWKLKEEVIKKCSKAKDWKWIMTKDFTSSKAEYYKLLSKAKISVSFALQETLGIAMIESVLSGAIPVAPNRLSYRELYSSVFKYETFDEAVNMVVDLIEGKDCEVELKNLREDFLLNGRNAIKNMVREMEVL